MVQTTVSHLELEAINYHLSPPSHRRLLTKTWHQKGGTSQSVPVLAEGLRLDIHVHTHCIPLWLRADGKLSSGG